MAVGNVSFDDCVHVGLRAAAGLPDTQRELVAKFAGNDFVCCLHDQLGFIARELAEFLIHECRGFFQDGESADQFGRHGVAANVKVM
jgi:hypothetical protein